MFHCDAFPALPALSPMTELGLFLVAASLAHGLYTFVLYPGILALLRRPSSPSPGAFGDGGAWPAVTVTVPAYNEEGQIAETLESLLRLDYPRDRLQLLVVSDASTDRTDEIVRGYAPRGVELVRQPVRAGKTAAEALAAEHITGEIVVNTDASVRILPDSLKPLIAPFADPEIGLVSGRDISVGREGGEANQGEAGYVGYEMWVRRLETRLEGIVGASGSFYAIRRELHGLDLPDSLSRDFAAALNTRERGFRPISVATAAAVVPRTRSLRHEYPRKVRTITRGIETLWHKRALLNPFRYRLYAWMLFSHKVCRWALPWMVLLGLVGLALAATGLALAGVTLAVALVVLLLGAGTWLFAGQREIPGALAVPAFLVMGNVATMHATLRALHGDRNPIWEPTRRHD